MKSYKYLIWLLVIALSISASAQRRRVKAGTITGYQQFISLVIGWQQAPLQAKLTVRSYQTKITPSAAGEAAQPLEFYRNGQRAYVRAGDVEQLMNDTMAVMINHDLKTISVYADVSVLSSMIQPLVQGDAAALNEEYLANKYQLFRMVPVNNASVMILKSKNQLVGFDLPFEEIQILYDSVRNVPLKITTSRRTATAIPETSYKDLLTNYPELQSNLVVDTNEGKCWLMIQKIKEFEFLSLQHEAGVDMPATITDCIGSSAQGSYTAVGPYTGYSIRNATIK